ncbi:hypothetical protein [Pseudomonas sp. Snoq117.2]|uniref:hypothetical protein n=1 Tax=Pseudomonas sp. Snoq117.2 TaxID=1500302 RepID=UPI0008C34EDA|nr:hypothetical protein [Pseudomonas sp. Snoq117.2]SEP30309.1 hypothetical protein SAMN02787149_105422 [Pseudomonas sp. Snoq117.2]
MGWLFSHPTRDALISELIANGETDNCTRTVIDHHLVDNVLWQVVKLVPKRDGIFPGVAAGEACVLIGCDLLDVHGGQWGHKSLDESSGPFYWSCPMHFLPGATHGINPEWREGVRRYHAAR